MDDRTMVGRIRNGDQEAFVELLDRYETKVYNLVHRMLPCRADVEDVAQEALIEIWKSIGSFRFESSLSTWIHRVAMNVALEHIRKCKHQQTDSNTSDELIEEIPDPTLCEPRSLYDHLESYELKEILEDALRKLPQEQRQVVVLHELNELTYREVADILGVPVGTVKSRLFLAIRKLRVILEPYVFCESNQI